MGQRKEPGRLVGRPDRDEAVSREETAFLRTVYTLEKNHGVSGFIGPGAKTSEDRN